MKALLKLSCDEGISEGAIFMHRRGCSEAEGGDVWALVDSGSAVCVTDGSDTPGVKVQPSNKKLNLVDAQGNRVDHVGSKSLQYQLEKADGSVVDASLEMQVGLVRGNILSVGQMKKNGLASVMGPVEAASSPKRSLHRHEIVWALSNIKMCST